MSAPVTPPSGTEIAVIGMAGRFPGAPDLDHFWQNLAAGRESIRRLDEATLRERGVAEALLANPAYVPAVGELDEADGFDHAFFGVSPREAEILDPQQRAFLECAWSALEDAACDPERFAGPIGVFGSGPELEALPQNAPLNTAAASKFYAVPEGQRMQDLAPQVEPAPEPAATPEAPAAPAQEPAPEGFAYGSL